MLRFAFLGNCEGLSEKRNLRHGFEFSVDYSEAGLNWGSTSLGAELCDTGLEQSPIHLKSADAILSKKMQQNGYGYLNYIIAKNQIKMPNF